MISSRLTLDLWQTQQNPDTGRWRILRSRGSGTEIIDQEFETEGVAKVLVAIMNAELRATFRRLYDEMLKGAGR